MTRLIRNRVFLFVAGFWFLYWPTAWLVPQQLLLEFMNGVIASLSIGILCAYVPAAWVVLRKRPYRLSGRDLLLLGVTTIQFAVMLLFIWSWTYRYLNNPAWMVDHLLRGWFIHLLLIGNGLLLLAWDVVEEKNMLPPKIWLQAGIVVACGFGMAVFAAMLT